MLGGRRGQCWLQGWGSLQEVPVWPSPDAHTGVDAVVERQECLFFWGGGWGGVGGGWLFMGRPEDGGLVSAALLDLLLGGEAGFWLRERGQLEGS